MTDLYATPTRFSWMFLGGPEVGEIHAGFGHALSDGWTKVVDAVRQVAPIPPPMETNSVDAHRTLWITGHSLGGALASLAGAAFSLLPGYVIRPVSGIYTFGQPRIGLHDFCDIYTRLLTPRTFRFVNNKDLRFAAKGHGSKGHESIASATQAGSPAEPMLRQVIE